MIKFKKITLILLSSLILITISGCSLSSNTPGEVKAPIVTIEPELTTKTQDELEGEIVSDTVSQPVSNSEISSDQFIAPEGNTLVTRINPPVGYKRIHTEEGSFQNYIGGLTLKKDGSKVLLYDGKEKDNQSAQVAIFDFDIGTSDLQQCADSIMRVYGEYLWSIGAYDKIEFHLTNGFLMEYSKWREGNRIHIDGNNVSWTLTDAYNDSYECFRKYMTMVFVYAGTLSLSEEGKAVALEKMEIGDMFIYGGSPGHCVLIVDMAQNEDGDKCFLLAQGYMPAQDFHILKNPLQDEDPWYYLSESEYPLETPQWTFDMDSLKRWLD